MALVDEQYCYSQALVSQKIDHLDAIQIAMQTAANEGSTFGIYKLEEAARVTIRWILDFEWRVWMIRRGYGGNWGFQNHWVSVEFLGDE